MWGLGRVGGGVVGWACGRTGGAVEDGVRGGGRGGTAGWGAYCSYPSRGPVSCWGGYDGFSEGRTYMFGRR